jgi:hypothetical protein
MAGITGFPQFPDSTLDPKIYQALMQIHLAIGNLNTFIREEIGAESPPESEWEELGLTGMLTTGYSTRVFLPASESILRGHTVNYWDDGGVLKCRLSDAATTANRPMAIANSSASAGEYVETFFQRCVTDSIGGLTTGALYWAHPTEPGLILEGGVGGVPPTKGTWGNDFLVAPIGVALSETILAVEMTLLGMGSGQYNNP